MKITPQHISLASGEQLSRLFGVNKNTITLWTTGQSEVSGRVLTTASRDSGIPKEILMKGLDLRREKNKEAQIARDEIENCIAESLLQVA